MKKLTSLDNLEIKSVASLADSKERRKQNKFVAEGIRTVATLLEANVKLIKIYCTEENLKQVEQFVDEKNICVVSFDIVKKISQTSTPSGILAVFEIPVQKKISELSEGIVLAQIQDPGNMGTLIRTAASMDLKTVIIIEGCDVWNPKVIQASAGTIGFVNIFEITWKELLEIKAKLELCALVVKGGKDFKEISFKNKILVVGNEANGIPQEWINDCEEKLTLKMPGKTESLNAAVAGSIAMYLAFGK